MALTVCRECEHQMSDTADACPQCGWARAAFEAHQREAAAHAAAHAASERLLERSTRIAAIGFAIMLVSAVLGDVTNVSNTLIMLGFATGLVLAGIAAVVRQIGRSRNNRS